MCVVYTVLSDPCRYPAIMSFIAFIRSFQSRTASYNNMIMNHLVKTGYEQPMLMQLNCVILIVVVHAVSKVKINCDDAVLLRPENLSFMERLSTVTMYYFY